VTTYEEHLVESAKAVAGLATNKHPVPMSAPMIKDDLAIRSVLLEIIRLWSEPVAATYTTLAACYAPKVHREHVVPCRVLAERMIKFPGQAKSLLTQYVIIANVTPEEHYDIGPLYRDHLELYELMLAKNNLHDLHSLGSDGTRTRTSS
jgi:hypothetical protein